ncbi:MAG: Tfp pilus assembly protein FimT/FimU [Desulfatibacillaceae bacterium]
MRDRGRAGFTLIELVSVLIVLGVLAAVGVARVPSMKDAEVIARADVVRSHLRYAQIRAMNAETPYGIVFGSGSYHMFRDGDTSAAGRVRLPGEDAAVVPLPAGMTISTGTVSFDHWGRPCTDAAANSPQSSDRTLTLSYDGHTRNLTIIQDTGFVP